MIWEGEEDNSPKLKDNWGDSNTLQHHSASSSNSDHNKMTRGSALITLSSAHANNPWSLSKHPCAKRPTQERLVGIPIFVHACQQHHQPAIRIVWPPNPRVNICSSGHQSRLNLDEEARGFCHDDGPGCHHNGTRFLPNGRYHYQTKSSTIMTHWEHHEQWRKENKERLLLYLS